MFTVRFRPTLPESFAKVPGVTQCAGNEAIGTDGEGVHAQGDYASNVCVQAEAAAPGMGLMASVVVDEA